MKNNKIIVYSLLVLPSVLWFYIGLFLTMELWYPGGLDSEAFAAHLANFSVIYVFWVITYFVYTLFDLKTFQNSYAIISRLLAATMTNGLIAISYFYFQPELILTPRRFLLVHLLLSFVGVAIWFAGVQRILPKIWRRQLFLHPGLYEQNLHGDVNLLVTQNHMLGWDFAGPLQKIESLGQRAAVLVPALSQLEQTEVADLLNYKQQGLEVFEFSKFYELTERTIQLEFLSEIWFLRSINYRDHRLGDMIKRLIDLIAGLLGLLMFMISFPVVGLLIKFNSTGPVLFVQPRVGRYGKVFRLYKFRTMSGGATNTWTQDGDVRITSIGRWLRKTRLDELPQAINLLVGNMSLVGPRPEQVHIVERLAVEIPYYNQRHSVKPGLTGWAQLHVYAATVEESKRKLQYDLYYIKHRGIWFDLEIILRTVFYFLSVKGK
ncbi:MAG: sugar transferase [Candidatus Doudnabacteria bacterium]